MQLYSLLAVLASALTANPDPDPDPDTTRTSAWRPAFTA